MKFTALERNVMGSLSSAIRDVTPGCMVRAYHNGRVICDVSAGQVYPYYDLASLTKIIFTTQAMMQAFDTGLWKLDSKVKEFVPWFPHESVTLVQLLTHTSGLTWWQPFYEKLMWIPPGAEPWVALKEMLAQSSIEKADKAVYSDVGFLVLGYVLESIYQKNLKDIWLELQTKFYNGTTLEFHPGNVVQQKASLYAPTEECPVRKRLIQGEVHDLNAWALGGVSTHAGLFGSIDDVGWYLLQIRSQLLGIARYSIRQKTAQLFAKRALPENVGDWALGYMMPTPGSASCGNYFSLDSIGHTGFTGTSVWYDPKIDLGVVILSNRVMYGKDNKAFAALRPQIHNWVVEGFRRSAI